MYIETKQSPAGLPVAGPLDVRSAALTAIAAIAVIVVLYFGRVVWIPLAFGVLISYALYPVVGALRRLRLPRPLGALLVVGTLLGLLGYGVATLQGQALALLDKVPVAAEQVRQSVQAYQNGPQDGLLGKAREAAAEVQLAVADGIDAPPPPPGVVRVQVEGSAVQWNWYLWAGSLSALTVLGQAATVLVLAFFFLAAGDVFKRKLARIAGPTLSRKKITVQIIDDFNRQIRRFLFVLALAGAFNGALSWLGYQWLGLEQAALWGVITGVVSTVPYLGPMVVAAMLTVMGLAQFGNLAAALTVAAVPLAVNAVEGWLLTPWLTSRAAHINTVMVFIGLLFWGWLWGPVGLMVGTPILIMLKVLCDHIENLQPLGELLGD